MAGTWTEWTHTRKYGSPSPGIVTVDITFYDAVATRVLPERGDIFNDLVIGADADNLEDDFTVTLEGEPRVGDWTAPHKDATGTKTFTTVRFVGYKAGA